jgi:hypothetical protein
VLASQPSIYREDLGAHERSVLWTSISHQQGGTRPSLASLTRGMQLFNAAGREVAEERGVGHVDLEAVVPKTLEYLYDDVHYTSKACELIAKAFFEHLEAAGTVSARMNSRGPR